MSNLILLAPMDGWAAPLDEVPDPVFSGRILGDGGAIDPTGATLCAPCDGTIASLAKHAVTVRAECGAEILVHIGLETVALDGQGFTARVVPSQKVKAGTPLIDFDLEFLAGRVKSLISPVIVVNGDAFRIVYRNLDRSVTTGDVLMELEPVVVGTSVAGAATGSASRKAVIKAVHGIHARPAAVISDCARRYGGEVALSLKEKKINAKSAVGLMTLGARCGDRVTVTASGAGAKEAVEAVAKLIETDFEPPSKTAAPPVIPKPQQQRDTIQGICAAQGIAVGRVAHFRVVDVAVPDAGAGLARETAELRRAVEEVKTRLERAASSGERARRDIMAAHAALLEDDELRGAAVKFIEQGKSAAFAWRKAVRGYADTLKTIGDDRMRERAGDLLDLERQVIAVLTGKTAKPDVSLPEAAIVVAEELLPSDLVALDAKKIAGIVMARGGATSHVAILAAGMNIPALVGAGAAVLDIAANAEVLLDANESLLHLKPDTAEIAKAKDAATRSAARKTQALAHASEECRTADGARIAVFANLGKGATEAAEAVRLGAEGCGVLRTEFLFMDRPAPPDEEEQTAAYRAIAEALGKRDFILRTFDFGGDKPVPYLTFPAEDNPALGMRGIRGGFLWPELLNTQLRAAIRMGCKIMLPMIASCDELTAVRATIAGLCKDLGCPMPELGVMIETPSSAMLADQLAREADFLSIGTNDLTQYVLAIDRGHRQLAGQLDALHPAILRLIARTAEAANAAGKPVAVCGGVAADPVAAPVLIGLGIEELSVPPPVIPNLKATVRALDSTQCRDVAQEALALDSAVAVRALMRSRFSQEVQS